MRTRGFRWVLRASALAEVVPARDLLALHLTQRRPHRLLIGGYVRVPHAVAERVNQDWVRSRGYEAYLTRRAAQRLLPRHLENRWQILIRRSRRPHG